MPWQRIRQFLLRIFSRSNALLAFGVQDDVMCTSCPTSPDISARDSRLRHSCGDMTSVQTLCTSQVFLTANTKTTSNCVTERVYCMYLLPSSWLVAVTSVDSPYVHARVLRGAISRHSGSKAFSRVQSMTVGNFCNCCQGYQVTVVLLFLLSFEVRACTVAPGANCRAEAD